MSRNLLHPTRRHPLTGARLAALGILPNGKVIWPILGGDDSVTPVEQPEGVTDEEWEALGDPGKKAIVRERARATDAERALAASRARPTPPSKPAGAPAGAPAADQPDIAALVAKAVADAVKPFADAEAERGQAAKAEGVRAAIRSAATGFHDADDAVSGIDAAAVLKDDGSVDGEKLTAALAALATKKPHLVRDTRRFAPTGAGGTGGAGKPEADRVSDSLATMAGATGLKLGN